MYKQIGTLEKFRPKIIEKHNLLVGMHVTDVYQVMSRLMFQAQTFVSRNNIKNKITMQNYTLNWRKLMVTRLLNKLQENVYE